MRSPRRLRLLPYHERLEALGAHFVESAGWERPQWYAANRILLGGSTGHGLRRHGWSARHWSPIIGAEHRAVRERVGLFDLTPFTKLEVSGAGATALLQKLCANQIDRPVGSIVYTAMLTPAGGIKCDLTVTRLAEDRFMIVTGGATSEHDRGADIHTEHNPYEAGLGFAVKLRKGDFIGRDALRRAALGRHRPPPPMPDARRRLGGAARQRAGAHRP